MRLEAATRSLIPSRISMCGAVGCWLLALFVFVGSGLVPVLVILWLEIRPPGTEISLKIPTRKYLFTTVSSSIDSRDKSRFPPWFYFNS